MKKTLVVDSTQIVEFDDCPQKWEYSSVEQLTQIDESRDSMLMGSYGHKLMEIYYRSIALGAGINEAYKNAKLYKLPDIIQLSKERQEAVEKRFFEYWIMRNHGINLGRDIKPACKEKYAVGINEDGLPFDTTEKVPMVELGFSYKLLDTPEYLFVLEGMIDLLGSMDGINLFMDHKWQERRRSLYKKSVQFRNYALASNCQMGIINYVRMAEKIDQHTFERDIISFTAQELRHWKQELIEIFIKMVNSAADEKREQRWGSCSGKFGWACEFTNLCEEFNPDMKQRIKDFKYKKKDPWTPWELAGVKVEVDDD